MNKRSTHRPALNVMEYLFLLPGILALSPLLVAQRRLRGLVDQATAVYGFRLLVLAHLLMFCAFILYCWRPSVRQRQPFIDNMIRVSFLGLLAVTPIAVASVLLARATTVEIEVFSALETSFGWGVLLVCAFINSFSLVTAYKQRASRSGIGRWDILSATFYLVFAMFLFRWV